MSALRPPSSARPFFARSAHELYVMSDDDLVAYIVAAKRSGAVDDATTGVNMLLFRHEGRMRRQVHNELPAHLRHFSETVEEWVLERVVRSALKLGVTGEHMGEWVNWWKTAVSRQVISFFRSAQGQALEREQEWPDMRAAAGDDGVADTVGVELDVDALAGSLDYRAALDAALAALNDKHRKIVDAAYFQDQASKDVGAEFGETVANVDQVKKRFKELLRAELTSRGVWNA